MLRPHLPRSHEHPRRDVGKFHKIAIYTRAKNPAGKWRYRAVRLGQGLKHPTPPFFLRYSDDFKQRYSSPYPSLEEAKIGAAKLRTALDAKSRGISVEQMDGMESVNRVEIKKAVADFLELKKSKAKTTFAGYQLHLTQFLASLKHTRFLDEITVETMRNFAKKMESEGLAGRTRHNRLMSVVFLLKKNGIQNPMPWDEFPIVDEEAAIAYTNAGLDRLFAKMSAADKLLFNFFLGSGCREREVVFAAWPDLDFERGTYNVRSKPEEGFYLKNHESREVPLPSDLVKALRTAKKTARHDRWVFVNRSGLPDKHMLRRFKAIALDADLNCGHCKTTITMGRATKRQVQVSCKDYAVCEHWYLHRLRKTCATRWQENGIPLRTIQSWLAHKDLNTTQKYLGVTGIDELRTKINSASKVR